MMRRHLVKVAAAAAVAVLGLTACGGTATTSGSAAPSASAGPVTLKVAVWNYSSTPEFKALFDAYTAKNPSVTIEPVDILASDYTQKVNTMLAGGDTTDLIAMKDIPSFAAYSRRGQLLDLSDLAAKAPADLGSKDTYKTNGKYFAIPYRQDFWVLYYNKAALKAANIDPASLTTWDAYSAAAKKMSAAGGGTVTKYGAYQHTWRSVVQAVACAQNKCDMLSGDYSSFKSQYDMTLDLQKSQAIMEWGTASTQKVTYQSQFETKAAAMIPMGSWYASSVIAQKTKGATDVEWGIAPLPQKAAGNVSTVGTPTAFAVNSKAKNAAAAKQFMAFIASEDAAKAVANVGVVPALRTAPVMDVYFKLQGMPNDALAQKAYKPDYVQDEMPNDEKSPKIDTTLNEEHSLIMTGSATVDAGLANMSKRVKAI